MRRSELEATRDSHLHQRSKFTTTTGKSVELRKPEVSNKRYITILLLISILLDFETIYNLNTALPLSTRTQAPIQLIAVKAKRLITTSKF